MAYNVVLSVQTELAMSLVLTTGEFQQGYLLELQASEKFDDRLYFLTNESRVLMKINVPLN